MTNRIRYDDDLSRTGRIKFAARAISFLKYMAEPANQMERMSIVDPLSDDWFAAEKRITSITKYMRLTHQERRFVFRD